MAQVADWQRIVISESGTLEQAIRKIESGGYQLCLVCGEDKCFRGIISDSDIRKAYLNGGITSDSISEVMNKKPLTVNQSVSEIEAERIMRLQQYMHLPIVDNNNFLQGLHILEQFRHRKLRKESVVIMAGGRGSRLMPLTKDLPKPMLPIQGKPMLEHIIERVRLSGFTNIIISVNYLSHKITEYFKDGKNFGVSIQYIHENNPLGTAGSLAEIKKIETKNDLFIITNGDIWTDLCFSDLLDFTIREKADGLVASRNMKHQVPYGVIKSQENMNRIIDIEEKPIQEYEVSAGIYVLNKAIINLIGDNEYMDMPDLIVKAISNSFCISKLTINTNWTDIGRMSDYKLIAEQAHT